MNYKKIFKKKPDKNEFTAIIKNISMLDNKKYIFYDELYKKNIDGINNYLLSLKDYYHNSKHKYLESLDFKKCITIIKHISSIYDISIETKRTYQNNSYKLYYILHI
jgi:hypothetical protein